ncbi:helix-turn-helix domain-containing protein [Streptomyces pimonensis]|uniref:Helix-turn-helix domain-containing protein n=1 Tax=Streptomyces pimonensis TaxID=2860288 RepID=A0ABV4J6U6_9ACTN
MTFTRGVTPEEVLARYGADARTARLLTRQQAAQLAGMDRPDGSVLRAGQLGDWSFCFEDYGVMGCMPGPLSALSRGTETFSVLRGGDGMNGFKCWRDGQCAEWFEPGAASTKPRPPHPWWDAVQERLDATGEEYPGLVPVLEATAHHTGVVLDTDTLDGPLLTLRLEDSDLTPDPPTRLQVPRPPAGVRLGPARPGPPLPPAIGQAGNAPTTRRTHGVRVEE